MSVNPEETAPAVPAGGEEAPLFDAPMKKKKKVTLDVDAELGLSTAAPEGEDENAGGADADGKTADDDLAEMFGSMKKKKKSASKRTQFAVDLENLPKPRTSQMTAAEEKKKAAAELVAEADAAEAQKEAEDAAPKPEAGEQNGDLVFGELKKKKKKSSSSTKGSTKMADFEKELAEAEAAAAGGDSDDDGEDGEGGAAEDGVDHTAEGDLGDDVFATDGAAEGADGAAGSRADDSKGDEAAAWLGSDRDYQYAELLGRIFKTLRQHNPALSGDKKKYTIVPPSVQREGSKKTLFANSLDICKRMHREPEHVYSFLFAELGTIGNIDGNQRLIIKGRFQPKQIENVLRKYIVEYVTCKTCKSPNTILSKKDRIYFMTCSTCGSTRSVSAIKTGFQAITGKRSKLRAK